MNDKKAELEKKKLLLEDLKKRKLEREKQKIALIKSSSNASNNVQTDLKSLEFNNLNVDEILLKCGINNGDIVKSLNRNKNDDESKIIKPSSNYVLSSYSIPSQNSNSSRSININKNSGNRDRNDFKETYASINEKLEKLNLKSEVSLNKIDIFPYEAIKYTKETQTIDDSNTNNIEGCTSDEDYASNFKANHDNFNLMNFETSIKKKKKKLKPLAFYDDIFLHDTFQWEDEFLNNEILEDSNHRKKDTDHNSSNDDLTKSPYKVKKHNEANHSITDSENYDEYDQVDHKKENTDEVNYDDFLKFLIIKRPVVERALNQNAQNIFFDYRIENNEKNKEESDLTKIKLKKSMVSTDKSWCSSIITCLDWSTQFPELVLASYDNTPFDFGELDSEAVTAVWNIKSDSKIPQQILTSTNLVTSCCFSPFHPNLIVAGTYSGQILMWDIRCNKRTPMQRSSLSIFSHVNPVYCVKVTSDAQSLISISNDGKLCSWSLENLNQPIETQELISKGPANKSVYATCFDFQNNTFLNTDQPETSSTTSNNKASFGVIGCEDGLVHSLSITNNNKFSISQVFDDHFGPLTSVSCFSQFCNEFNKGSSEINETLSQLFLTSSFDSSVKLWSLKDNTSPIYSFECNGDYVYDVGWSPVHPGVFACVDGSGRLDIWNLNRNFEMPSASIDIENRTRALNKLKWSKNGVELAVGDDHGKISILEINESFAQPNIEDYNKFYETTHTLKQLLMESKSLGLQENFSY